MEVLCQIINGHGQQILKSSIPNLHYFMVWLGNGNRSVTFIRLWAILDKVVLEITSYTTKRLSRRYAIPRFENRHTICRALVHGSAFSINRTKPIRGQLEIEYFGRANLVQQLSTRSISLPYLLFADGFNVYRSIQRSLMGVYFTPACLPISQRSKRANTYPLTLGPHGSNFIDVMESLLPLRQLAEGITVQWDDGKPMWIYAFALAFTGDMLQQQANAGMLPIYR